MTDPTEPDRELAPINATDRARKMESRLRTVMVWGARNWSLPQASHDAEFYSSRARSIQAVFS